MAKPLILITGANQGIGFATAQHLANTGNYHLLIGARSILKGETAITELLANSPVDRSSLTPIVIDVTDDASIASAATFVTDTFGKLDILINNAGICKSPDPAATLRDSFRTIFETNVFGVAVITAAFLPLLRASQYPDRRIVNVSTGLGQFGVVYSPTSPYGAIHFSLTEYRSSKAAVNMITAVDAVRLKDEGILVVAASPGYCRTNFTGGKGVKDAAQGARNIVRAAVEGEPESLFGTLVAEEYPVEEVGW
ncbi:hypothetical protein BDV25DRAFT_165219 [Aspergillus avenaceus]|uniref:Short-chain dehydrogenase n=1 Tax=Aspergillus avenaceus TaxID=36643 RepID=A0A5N6TGD1_ASPAV|nr:hypothetical protein BDV25DRAFT_165219 [Aspergillus avenaceus]